MNFVRADLFAKVIYKIAMKLNNGLKIYNYTSSFWIDNFDIFNLFADKYGLSTIKKSGDINLPKRFNASNLFLQNELINLESQFNETMQKYIRTYKKYLEQLISRQTSVNTKLKNTVVTYDGGFYYINNVGTAREFTSSSWNQRDQRTLSE